MPLNTNLQSCKGPSVSHSKKQEFCSIGPHWRSLGTPFRHRGMCECMGERMQELGRPQFHLLTPRLRVFEARKVFCKSIAGNYT